MNRNFQLLIALALIGINLYDIYHVGFEWKHAFFMGFAGIFIVGAVSKKA